MKRLLTLLSSLLLVVGILTAQTVPVLISGTVADVSGNGVENLPVDIFSDSTLNFSYTNQVITDVNGYYADTIEYPISVNFGIFGVTATDCDGSQIGEIVFFKTDDPVVQEVDLLYCDTIGGWPPLDSCFAHVVCIPDLGLLAEAFGTPPFTYEWSNGETTEAITPQVSGLFCVTVTDANGCMAIECSEYDIDAPCGPVIFDSCFAAVSLDRGNILTANAYGEAPFTFLWNNGETTQEIAVQNSGEYCVIIEDSEGCIAQGCYYYFGGVWPPIDSCFAQVTCDPDGNLIANAFGEPPFTYLWNTGEITELIMPQDTGTYCVTITDSDGCVAEGCSHYVGPDPGFDCQAAIFDIGGALEVFVTDPTNVTFLWSTGETTNIIMPTDDGIYCVTVFDIENDCYSETCYDYISNGWPPNDSCFAQVTCDPDGNLVADAFGSAPYTYIWNTGETTQTIMPQDTGLFCVTITDAEGCVAEACSHYVGGPGGIDSCFAFIIADLDGLLIADGLGLGPFSYLWSTGETTQMIFPQDEGEYCVVIADSDGCISQACIYYVPSIWNDTCGVSVTCDPDGNLVADAFGTAPFTYLWNTGETTQVIMPQDTGIYCVTVTDADGCTSEGCSHYIGTGPGGPGWPIDSLCDGFIFEGLDSLGGRTLYALALGNPPFTYQWNNGATSESITVNDPEVYCVTITDASGCTVEVCSDDGPNPVSSNIVSGYLLLVDSSQFFGFLTGTVDLIDIETGDVILETDVVNLDGFPIYSFEDVPDGDYIIRAEVTDVNGNNYLPTYHFGTTLSTEAEVVSVPYTSQSGWTNFDIVILGEIDLSGKGWISGNVTKEPGLNGGGDIRRATLNDISILLFDENHGPLQHVYTNESGNFMFEELAYGTYHVYIDEPGHDNHYYTVVLAPDTPGFDGLHFNINDAGITVNGPLSSAIDIDYVSEFKLAPNPAYGITNVFISSNKTGEAILELTDISGKKLSSQSLRLDGQKQSVEIKLNNLTSGIYLVRLIDGNHTAVEKLMIK